MFVKLKASLSPRPRADDVGKEARRRRRLSKPLTNKSSANPLILYTQQLDGQANNSSDLDISPASLSTPSSQGNFGEVIQASVSEPKPHILQTSAPIPGQEYWKSATFIVSKNPVEGVDSSMLLSPRSSLKAKRPLSAIVTLSNSRKASNSARRRASLQALAALAENEPDKAEKARAATTVPCSPESQSEALSPRLHRRSSFTPGVATRTSRKPSWSPSPVREQSDTDRNHYHTPTSSEEPSRSQLEVLDFDEEWAPPAPPVARSETPSDLDYTHLGGLRLGSLQVVNGRASPAPSELSRHLAGASTPNLKRDASSNYGDAEDGTLVTLASLRQKSYQGRDQRLQDFTTVPRKPVAAPLRSQTDGLVLPKRGKPDLHASSNRVEATSVWMPAPRIDPPLSQRTSSPLDKTSELAMAYMAELSASPYSVERSTSPAGSVLKSTSKATEFDDDLFEDDAADLSSVYEMDYQTPDTHPVSSDPVWVCEDAYRLSVKRSRDSSSGPSLQPSNSTGSSVKPDSGYGSNISLQSLKGQTDKASGKSETTVPNKDAVQANAVDTERLRGRPGAGAGAGPGPKPSRPSILKRHSSTALQVPDFSNLYPSTTSTTTLATITSTSSAPPAAPAKHRKLQKKARPRSQPPPVRQIVIQGQHRDFSNGDVPPPPTEIVANLAIRSHQVPELDHTFSSMHHSREIENSPESVYMPTFVNFPQTDSRPNDSLTEMNRPAPPSHRASLIKWPKTERRVRASGDGGISEDHAMAIIRDLDTAGSSMGGSPYDVANRTTKSVASQAQQSKTPNDSHTRYQNPSRSRAMMDDATAAELARLRSRTIAERDDTQWKQRRSSFNDRGGIPGRNIKPMSTAEDAPPLPALPSHEKVRQRESQKVDHQRPYLETRATEKHYPEQVSYNPYESLAPPPPSHSPRPRTIELEGDLPPPPPSHSPRPRSIDLPEDPTGPPPPPSHSPRPTSIRSSQEVSMPRLPLHSPYPIPVWPQEESADIWAAQASAWKSRRKSIGEMLRSRTLAPDDQGSTRPFAVEEAIIDDPIYPEIPLRHLQKSFTTGPEEYGRSDMQFSGAHPEPNLYKLTGRPGPSGKTIDLAHSRHSQGPSRTSSHLVLAEESHMPQDQRPQPPPQFGRYGGGLDYGYEHGAGFGGSAGTRSVSGVAKGTRKGVPLSEGFGVDLSDVPIIASIRRKPVG